MEVDEGVEKMRDTCANVEEKDDPVVKVEVEIVRHGVCIFFNISTGRGSLRECRGLLNLRKSLHYQDQAEEVLEDVENVVGGHSDIVNKVHLELQIHGNVGVIEVPDDLVDASEDDPVLNVWVLQRNW